MDINRSLLAAVRDVVQFQAEGQRVRFKSKDRFCFT